MCILCDSDFGGEFCAWKGFNLKSVYWIASHRTAALQVNILKFSPTVQKFMKR